MPDAAGWSAIAAGAAAVVTAWMAFETRRVANRTQLEAETSVQLLQEARDERREAVRPWLSATMVNEERTIAAGPDVRTTHVSRIRISNAGTGPAFGCTCAAPMDGEKLQLTEPVDVPAGGAVNASWQIDDQGYELSWFQSGEHRADGAIFCRDSLGRRYRFLGRRTPTGMFWRWPEIASPSDYPREASTKDWRQETRLWGSVDEW